MSDERLIKLREETNKLSSTDFAKQLPDAVKHLDMSRGGDRENLPVDISFGDFAKEKWGLTMDGVLEKLGMNRSVTTLESIVTYPDTNYRWLVPEIIRTAVDLGLRTAPIYPNLIASDQSVNGLQALMPYVNMSDATPAKVNEAETIPLGSISYGQKSVNLFKVAKGIKVTYEVRSFVSLDVLGIFFRDFGIKLGTALDTLAMDVLINGNKIDGSESAPVIGVGTTGSIVYRDLLRVWIRAARMGRNFNNLIGGEDVALDLLDLPEFKDRQSGTTQATLTMKTPVPNQANFFIHPSIPAGNIGMLDKSAALIKLTAKALMMESEKIVSNQTDAYYASLTTGFSKMYLDAFMLMNESLSFATNGFPEYFDVDGAITGGFE